ncbi:hypothetical protein PAMP_019371 [Pampus punctatissimus]
MRKDTMRGKVEVGLGGGSSRGIKAAQHRADIHSVSEWVCRCRPVQPSRCLYAL